MRMNDGACDSQRSLLGGDDARRRVSGRAAACTGSTPTARGDDAGRRDDLERHRLEPRRDRHVLRRHADAGVDAFDFDAASGATRTAGALFAIEEGAGIPDGLIVDAEGCLWVALWGGWASAGTRPTAMLADVVEVPAARVTKPAFGGPRPDDLYITTAAPDTPDRGNRMPAASSSRSPASRGLPAHAYAG